MAEDPSTDEPVDDPPIEERRWNVLLSRMRDMLEREGSSAWGPLLTVSESERVLLRLFRTLEDSVQQERLENMWVTALRAVYPEIEEGEGEDKPSDEEIEDRENRELQMLMPEEYEFTYYLKQHLAELSYEMNNRTKAAQLVFQDPACDAGEEYELAATIRYEKKLWGIDEDTALRGFFHDWRQAVISEIEWRTSTRRAALLIARGLVVVGGQLTPPPSRDWPDGMTIGKDSMREEQIAGKFYSLLLRRCCSVPREIRALIEAILAIDQQAKDEGEFLIGHSDDPKRTAQLSKIVDLAASWLSTIAQPR